MFDWAEYWNCRNVYRKMALEVGWTGYLSTWERSGKQLTRVALWWEMQQQFTLIASPKTDDCTRFFIVSVNVFIDSGIASRSTL